MTHCRSGLMVAAVAAGSIGLFAIPAQAQDRDRDCGDFRSQPSAQRFFERQGPGDPHDLDRDNDGKACETLPGGNGNGRTRVGICHATGSRTNPYVFIRVSQRAVEAHRRHQGGRDIIGVESAAQCPKNRGGNNGGGNNGGGNNGQTPRGGVEAGAGGTAAPALPTLPAAGVVLGTALLGAGVMAARRRATAK